MASQPKAEKAILLIYPYSPADFAMMTNMSGEQEFTAMEEFALHSRIEEADPGLIEFNKGVAETAEKFNLTQKPSPDPFQRVLFGCPEDIENAQTHIRSLGYTADVAHQRQIAQVQALHEADKLIKPYDPLDDDDDGPQGGGSGGYH